MSALNRALAGAPLHFGLRDEIESLRVAHSDMVGGRTARTLVKDGPLRVTLIALDAGGSIAAHAAEGPITIHVLRGTIRLELTDDALDVHAGEIVSLPTRARHAVSAAEDAAFLLTVVLPDAGA